MDGSKAYQTSRFVRDISDPARVRLWFEVALYKYFATIANGTVRCLNCNTVARRLEVRGFDTSCIFGANRGA